jgi:hypothetical protein
MCKNLNEIKNELKDQLNEHLNKLKLNKQLKQKVDNEINDITIDLTRFIVRQKIELLKKTNENEKIIESNLNNLINKENDLLNKLEVNNNYNYNELMNDYNELNSFKSLININFDCIFKKNEINENYLRIGNLMVNIYLLVHLIKFKLESFIFYRNQMK